VEEERTTRPTAFFRKKTTLFSSCIKLVREGLNPEHILSVTEKQIVSYKKLQLNVQLLLQECEKCSSK